MANNIYSNNTNKYKRKSSKRKKKSALSIIVSIIIFLLCGYFGYDYLKIEDKTDDKIFVEPSKITDQRLEYAKCDFDDILIPHDYFTIGYNKSTVQPNWVGYYLSKSNLIKPVTSRTEDFREDVNCPLPRATLQDYKGSGYDRGHLAPAADFKFSEDAMSQTFLLSNMSPQLHNYNAGIWAKLESIVRRNAWEYGNLYVITGPYFAPGAQHNTIGANKISVPDGYYKALLVYNDAEKKAIAFYIPHSDDEKSNMAKYAMSVDALEGLVGIDFFYNLPDADEEKLEMNYDISLWSMREYQK